MKRNLVLFAFLLLSGTLSAQCKIFRTYEEYVNGGGLIVNEEDFKITIPMIKVTDAEGNKHKFDAPDIWGFVYKDQLFRTVSEWHYVAVIDTGKVIYYENGQGIYEMLRKEKDRTMLKVAFLCYLSVGLNSEIYPMPIYIKNALLPVGPGYYKAFRKKYPQHKILYDCIESADKTEYKEIGKCVMSYNRE